MRSVFLIFVCLSVGLISFGQSTIKYVLPSTVEDSIVNYIALSFSKDDEIWLYLSKEECDIFCVTVVKRELKSNGNLLGVNDWVQKTNRVAAVGERFCKILFDYDFSFGAVGDEIGKFGEREGRVKKLRLMTHGVSIYFDSYGNLINMLDKK